MHLYSTNYISLSYFTTIEKFKVCVEKVFKFYTQQFVV